MDERVFRDSRGIEWEVFDESDALSVALEFDHVPPVSNPGLLFVSTLGRRRLWPCPAGWQFLEDRELEGRDADVTAAASCQLPAASSQLPAANDESSLATSASEERWELPPLRTGFSGERPSRSQHASRAG